MTNAVSGGVLPAEVCPDEPVQDRRAPRGGGGRKHGMGMRAPPAKKGCPQASGGTRAEQVPGKGEEPPEKRPRVDLGRQGRKIQRRRSTRTLWTSLKRRRVHGQVSHWGGGGRPGTHNPTS